MLEVLSGNRLVTLGVETFEGVLDDVFGICTVKFLTEERQERGEVDVAGRFLDHVVEVLTWWVFAHGREHAGEIFLRDESVTILIDHVERLLELLNLRLTEQRKDIGGGFLGLFLSGSLLFAHLDR